MWRIIKIDACYVSTLLTTKEVFEKMQLGFFIVGHMDEDINGSYGYLSTILKKYIFVLT
jgi:hypothetical protein